MSGSSTSVEKRLPNNRLVPFFPVGRPMDTSEPLGRGEKGTAVTLG
jgi:hypothetical protein